MTVQIAIAATLAAALGAYLAFLFFLAGRRRRLRIAALRRALLRQKRALAAAPPAKAGLGGLLGR